MKYRLNQRLCRIEWKRGQPFIRVGRVTRVTKQTYYVDGSKKQGHNWHTRWKDAIEYEYDTLFAEWGLLVGSARKRSDWTVRDTVRCTCRVRRLERKLQQALTPPTR